MKSYNLIGIERRGNLFFGVVIDYEKDKQKLYIETGEKISIPINKTLYKFSLKIEADNEKNIKLKIKKLKEEIIKKINIELMTLWECIEENEPYKFDELLTFYFNKKDDIKAGALFIALQNDNLYFQFKNGSFYKISPEIVESHKKREKIEKENRKIENLLIDWLNNKLKKIKIEEQPVFFHKLLESLKIYALKGEEKANSEAKRVVSKLNLNSNSLLILLEQKGILPKDINETLYKYEIEKEFPKEVIKESEELIKDSNIKENNKNNNIEYVTDEWNIAIDEEDTVEIDDALSFYENNKNFRIGVHIANVAHTIQIDSKLDKWAKKRFSTLYFPEERLFLFPEELIIKKLTLSLDNIRPAISCFFYFTKDGELFKYEFKKTLFKLKKRLSYKQTIEEVKKDKILNKIYEISLKLMKNREKNNAIISNFPKIKIKVNNGDINLIKSYKTPGDIIVSEFMILFNHYLAKKFIENNVPALFRVQPPPNNPIPQDKKDPLFFLKIKWALSSSYLSLSPESHYMLGVSSYVQGTSPIRRYSDLVMQRQLIAILDKRKSPYSYEKLKDLKNYFEKIEKVIKSADYERFYFWLLKYLKKNKGIYKGYVSRLIKDNIVMIFFPDFLQEFPYKVQNKYDSKIGKTLFLKILNVSPRKKKIRFEKVIKKRYEKEK